MYVFLGGRNSDTVNRLASVITVNHAVDVEIISLDRLEEAALEILGSYPFGTYFILSFTNKSNKLTNRLRSANILRLILLSLKKLGVPDNYIIILGSDSYLGSDFERYCNVTKYGLLRDPYAFDCASKYLVTKEVFPNCKIIHVPGLFRKRTLILKVMRAIIFWTVAKTHALNFSANVHETTFDEVAEQITTDIETLNDKDPHFRFQIKFPKIIRYEPQSILKFHASILANNKSKTPKVIEEKFERDVDYKFEYYIVTPLNKVDDNFHITYANIIRFLDVLRVRWVICVPREIFCEVQELTQNNNRIIVEIENYPSIYGAYNTFLKLYGNTSGYYIPLSAGDILFCEGVVSAMKYCENAGDLVVFANVLKHGSYIHTGLLVETRLNSGTHKIVTGHSAACLIKIEAHKIYGEYDLSYRLAADNCFFEKVYADSPSKIGKIDKTFGYFPPGGISQNNYIESYTELFRSRIENKYPIVLELLILWIRLFRIKA